VTIQINYWFSSRGFNATLATSDFTIKLREIGSTKSSCRLAWKEMLRKHHCSSTSTKLAIMGSTESTKRAASTSRGDGTRTRESTTRVICAPSKKLLAVLEFEYCVGIIHRLRTTPKAMTSFTSILPTNQLVAQPTSQHIRHRVSDGVIK